MSEQSESTAKAEPESSDVGQLRAEVARLSRTVDALTQEVRRLVRVTAQAIAQRQVEQSDSIVTVHRLDGGGMEIRVRDTSEQTQTTKQVLEEALAIREEGWLGGYE